MNENRFILFSEFSGLFAHYLFEFQFNENKLRLHCWSGFKIENGFERKPLNIEGFSKKQVGKAMNGFNSIIAQDQGQLKRHRP